MNDCENRMVYSIVRNIVLDGRIKIENTQLSTLNSFTFALLLGLHWLGYVTKPKIEVKGDLFITCTVEPSREVELRERLVALSNDSFKDLFKPDHEELAFLLNLPLEDYRRS